MLTDIIKESSELLYVGDGAEELISSAFGIKAKNGSFLMKGVVSRKKQVIPAAVAAASLAVLVGIAACFYPGKTASEVQPQKEASAQAEQVL